MVSVANLYLPYRIYLVMLVTSDLMLVTSELGLAVVLLATSDLGICQILVLVTSELGLVVVFVLLQSVLHFPGVLYPFVKQGLPIEMLSY